MCYFEASRKENSLVMVSNRQFVFTLCHTDVFSTVSLSLVKCFSQQMLCEVDIIRVEGQELSAGALWVYGL